MIAGAQSSGTGVNPPSPYEIRTKYLDMEVITNLIQNISIYSLLGFIYDLLVCLYDFP